MMNQEVACPFFERTKAVNSHLLESEGRVESYLGQFSKWDALGISRKVVIKSDLKSNVFYVFAGTHGIR